MLIVSVIASNPSEDPTNPAAFGAPVTWKLNEPVPGVAGLIIRQLVLVNGEVHVFALPQEGSDMEKGFIQQSGTKQGFRFILVPPHIRITASIAPINEWMVALQEAVANTDDMYGEPDDGGDEEEEEEEEEDDAPEEVPPPPPAELTPATPSTPTSTSFIPNNMTPNGQS